MAAPHGHGKAIFIRGPSHQVHIMCFSGDGHIDIGILAQGKHVSPTVYMRKAGQAALHKTVQTRCLMVFEDPSAAL